MLAQVMPGYVLLGKLVKVRSSYARFGHVRSSKDRLGQVRPG
jgi:hypothetical protein